MPTHSALSAQPFREEGRWVWNRASEDWISYPSAAEKKNKRHPISESKKKFLIIPLAAANFCCLLTSCQAVSTLGGSYKISVLLMEILRLRG